MHWSYRVVVQRVPLREVLPNTFSACKREYQIFIGASTASLLVSLLAAGDLENLRSAYCTIDQSSIFNNCPFRIKQHKQGGHCTASINHFNIIKMFLKGKKTFGESRNLRQTIERYFTHENYSKVRDSNKELIVTVSNLSMIEVEYNSVHDYDFESFCDWIWAFSNMIPFMSLHIHNGMEYADSGIGNNIPLEEAINRGASSIDSIILSPQEKLVNKMPSRNVFDLTFEIFDFMLNQLTKKHLEHSMIYSVDKRRSIDINTFHTPVSLQRTL